MGQTDYNLQSDRPGSPGVMVDARDCDLLSGVVSGAVAQVDTIVVGGANDASYTVTVTLGDADYSVSYTKGGADGTDEIAAGLQAALKADLNINGYLVPTVSSSTVTLTARVKNKAFTVTVTSSDLTASTTTAAAAAGDIPFGVAVVEDSAVSDGFKLGAASDYTNKVIHATPTVENNGIYTLTIFADANLDGHKESYTATYTADGSASAQEIVEALQASLDAQMPSNTVAITEDDAKVIFTGELPGLDFVVTGSGIGSTAAWSISTDTAIVAPRFGGIAGHSMVEANQDGEFVFQGGDTLSRVGRGPVWARIDAGVTPTAGNPAFVRVTASASEQRGALRDSADGADCALVPSMTFMESAAYNVGGVRVAKVMVDRLSV